MKKHKIMGQITGESLENETTLELMKEAIQNNMDVLSLDRFDYQFYPPQQNKEKETGALRMEVFAEDEKLANDFFQLVNLMKEKMDISDTDLFGVYTHPGFLRVLSELVGESIQIIEKRRVEKKWHEGKGRFEVKTSQKAVRYFYIEVVGSSLARAFEKMTQDNEMVTEIF